MRYTADTWNLLSSEERYTADTWNLLSSEDGNQNFRAYRLDLGAEQSPYRQIFFYPQKTVMQASYSMWKNSDIRDVSTTVRVSRPS